LGGIIMLKVAFRNDIGKTRIIKIDCFDKLFKKYPSGALTFNESKEVYSFITVCSYIE
jgi:hypothetical protein